MHVLTLYMHNHISHCWTRFYSDDLNIPDTYAFVQACFFNINLYIYIRMHINMYEYKCKFINTSYHYIYKITYFTAGLVFTMVTTYACIYAFT